MSIQIGKYTISREDQRNLKVTSTSSRVVSSQMRAEIETLRKYYSTKINYGGIVIELYGENGEFKPSDRELKKSNVTREQFENNELVHSFDWNGIKQMEPAMSACEFEYSHCERQSTYELAVKIMEMLNK